LLVFDDAEDPHDLGPYWPSTEAGGRVLVTSRNPNWQPLAATLPVDVCPPRRRSGSCNAASASTSRMPTGLLRRWGSAVAAGAGHRLPGRDCHPARRVPGPARHPRSGTVCARPSGDYRADHRHHVDGLLAVAAPADAGSRWKTAAGQRPVAALDTVRAGSSRGRPAKGSASAVLPGASGRLSSAASHRATAVREAGGAPRAPLPFDPRRRQGVLGSA
jgi:hypothetical protein